MLSSFLNAGKPTIPSISAAKVGMIFFCHDKMVKYQALFLIISGRLGHRRYAEREA